MNAEADTFVGMTFDGWSYVATVRKAEKYVVKLRLISPLGHDHLDGFECYAGGFRRMQDALAHAQQCAEELTPFHA